jgi:hypothetical protein
MIISLFLWYNCSTVYCYSAVEAEAIYIIHIFNVKFKLSKHVTVKFMLINLYNTSLPPKVITSTTGQ